MQRTADHTKREGGVDYRFRRALLAFAVAPLAGPLGICCGYFLPIMFTQPVSLMPMLLLIYLVATPVVYFFSLLLGVPLYLTLRALRRLNRTSLTVGWTIIGVVSLMIFSGGGVPAFPQDAWMLMPFALGGWGVGYLFWHTLSSRQRA